jgi:hypothetical protein
METKEDDLNSLGEEILSRVREFTCELPDKEREEFYEIAESLLRMGSDKELAQRTRNYLLEEERRFYTGRVREIYSRRT